MATFPEITTEAPFDDFLFDQTVDIEDVSPETDFYPSDAETFDDLPTEYLEHDSNLAAYLPEDELTQLTLYCEQRYKDDSEAMSDYFTVVKDGIEQLGVKIEDFNEPFPGACSVQHPLVLESSLKMQAKIKGEIFNGRPLVDVRLGTEAPDEVRAKANRAKNYVNYQLMSLMSEYEEETERLALRYALSGNSYRRFWYDTALRRVVCRHLPEDSLIYNSKRSTIELVDFYTELDMLEHNELKARIASGEFLSPLEDEMPTDEELLAAVETSHIEETVFGQTGDPNGVPQSLAEKHSLRWHFLKYQFKDPYNEGSDIALPYMVCYHVGSNKIIGVYRNWEQRDADRKPLVWHSQYRLVPGLGGLGWGYIQMLGNPQMALTLMLRSVIDAGQFANLQAGIKNKDIKFTANGQLPLAPGQFVDVDTTNMAEPDLSKGLKMLEFKEPSQVLERLIGSLDMRIQKFADSTETVVGDSTNYGPVGTTVALIEASARFHNDILKRFNRSLEREFKILKQINRMTLQPNTQYYWKGILHTVGPEDFDDQIELISSSDPSFSSQAQRLQRANMKIQTARLNPELHNLREAYLSFYREVGLEEDEIARLLPPPGQAVAQDPMSDIFALTKGQAIAAFPGQNHQAHIDFKSAFLSDPKAGANPSFGPYVALLEANIIEHGLLMYQEQLQAVMASAGVNPQDEMAQAQAAQALVSLHNLANNQDLLAAGDPTAILAQTEAEKTKIAKEKLELEKVKLALEEQRLNRDLDRKDAEASIKAQEVGAKINLEDKKVQLQALTLAQPKPQEPQKKT